MACRLSGVVVRYQSIVRSNILFVRILSSSRLIDIVTLAAVLNPSVRLIPLFKDLRVVENHMNMHDKKILITGSTLIATGLLANLPSLAQESVKRLNVLFIAVDDLRPQLGCYGQEQIKSPNIDRLAKRGVLFERAYCQMAICMASRASLLSGYRPDKGQIYQNKALFTHVPDALTLNQHFINNGYEAVAMGKIYHHASDYEQGWSSPAFKAKGEWKGRGYLSKDSQSLIQKSDDNSSASKRTGMGPAFESPDVPDNAYADGLTAEHAIQELNRLKDKPFFMAVGFTRPHLPFNAPKKYWDLYPENEIKLSDNPLVPDGAPKEALTDWSELRGYVGMPVKGPMPENLTRQLIHGCYASVSYTDAMIGRVLDELDRLGLAENTIVVLWGDHGWKLGDYGMWCKHTAFQVYSTVCSGVMPFAITSGVKSNSACVMSPSLAGRLMALALNVCMGSSSRLIFAIIR